MASVSARNQITARVQTTTHKLLKHLWSTCSLLSPSAKEVMNKRPQILGGNQNKLKTGAAEREKAKNDRWLPGF